ncbi:hypothetical protein ADUPG1_007066, partial [Aduncisulcus paluster]
LRLGETPCIKIRSISHVINKILKTKADVKSKYIYKLITHTWQDGKEAAVTILNTIMHKQMNLLHPEKTLHLLILIHSLLREGSIFVLIVLSSTKYRDWMNSVLSHWSTSVSDSMSVEYLCGLYASVIAQKIELFRQTSTIEGSNSVSIFEDLLWDNVRAELEKKGSDRRPSIYESALTVSNGCGIPFSPKTVRSMLDLCEAGLRLLTQSMLFTEKYRDKRMARDSSAKVRRKDSSAVDDENHEDLGFGCMYRSVRELKTLIGTLVRMIRLGEKVSTEDATFAALITSSSSSPSSSSPKDILSSIPISKASEQSSPMPSFFYECGVRTIGVSHSLCAHLRGCEPDFGDILKEMCQCTPAVWHGGNPKTLVEVADLFPRVKPVHYQK